MKIYHYTTIQTLALIIKHKTIRFNRLDHVDDCEESNYGSGQANTRLGKYQFVSCWTKDAQENLALWKMYTNNKGVRIGLDDDMFVSYPVNETFKSYFSSPIEIREDFFVSSFMNEVKLYDMKYVEDVEAETKKLIKETPNGGIAINTNDASLFKRKEWSVQHESRFKITVLPLDERYIRKPKKMTAFDVQFSVMNALGASLMSNKSIKTEFIDIPLRADALQDIEIMMGPQTSEGERIIVESLLHECKKATISDSYFKGKLRK